MTLAYVEAWLAAPPDSDHEQVRRPSHHELDQAPVLLTRIQRGDAQAFEQVFTAMYDRLCSFAIEHGLDADAASDIVQDVMVAFWQRRGEWQLSTGRALTGYLFQAVRNLIARHHRDRHSRYRALATQRESEATLGHSTSPLLPDRHTETEALYADLDAAISAMPRDRRIAVSLRVYDGMSYDEIAAILGVGAPAIRMHLSRARAALAEVFQKHRG